MSQVISFEDYRPAPRFDDVAWTEARIEEAETSSGPWTLIDTINLDPVDADPANPASRSFTTALATDTPDLWYRIVFADAGGDTLLPSFAVQNTDARTIYASVEELAALLRVKVNDRRAALLRVLEAAATEIDAELSRTEAFETPPRLVEEVSLERAVEHWQQGQAPFGILGLGGEAPIRAATASWERHAHKLAPLKQQWGLA